MPLIQVFAPQDTLSKKEQKTLMSRLSNAVLQAEGAPLDSIGAQSLVWAYYVEQAHDSIYIGGKNLEPSPLRIAITTPEGALTERTRNSLIAEIGTIVDDSIGLFEGRLNHWTMLNEIDDGCWGGAGQVFHLSDIQTAMNIQAA
ncbi:MAG: hypothetical protein OQL19_13505 [Gammaproteobacteria bacterium]|nr:hypothetical protein [Gammaproteobacteria bacterium]